jgi:hypothetical protein
MPKVLLRRFCHHVRSTSLWWFLSLLNRVRFGRQRSQFANCQAFSNPFGSRTDVDYPFVVLVSPLVLSSMLLGCLL